MAAIQSLGIGSGILNNDLVDDLIAAERGAIDLRLDFQEKEFEAEISAYGTITAALEKFRTASDSLKAPSTLQSISASSSDDSALTATASSLAEVGNYSVKINQIAQSQALVTSAYSAITDIVGTGEITFRFGTTTFSSGNYDNFALDTTKTSKTLIIDSSNNTLTSLRAAINLGDFGVQATIINDGTGFRLSMSPEKSGISNSMEILVANAGASGLKELAFNSTYNSNVAVGAITEGGSLDLSVGVDFATTNANFTISTGLTTGIAVTVNQDATSDLGGGGNTPEDNRIAIQNALDVALAAAGLNAGDVIASIDPNDGGLILTTLATGGAQTLEITSDDAVLGLNPNLGTQFGSNGSLQQTQTAQSAELEVNGLTITRESNLVTEVINGVTLNLQTADPAKTINLALKSDPDVIIEKVKAFVEAFNELKVISDQLTIFDLDTGESGLLLGDSTLRTINSRVRDVMNSIVTGITGAKFRTLSEVGIFTDQNNSFLLNVDNALLSKSIEENPDAIVSLFATNRSATDPLIEVINTGVNSVPGSYDVDITQLATQGSYNGATVAALATNVVIDGNNDEFVINVNGVNSSTITLSQGTYTTGALLAQELQLRINNDSAIAATGDAVTVTYNVINQRFDFLSSDYGSSSTISFSSPDTNTEAELGFGDTVGTVNSGLDVKGTINGEAATGAGQFLRASDGSLAAKPGFLSGAVLGSLNVPLTITSGEVTAGDYDFKINVDGIISGTIALPAATYNTATELATALQTAINADSIFSAIGKTVKVDFDVGLSQYGVISNTTGKTSSANFTELSANLISQFGFAIGGGTQGSDATGKLNDAAGIRIRVIGGSLGPRGSVSYIEGTAFKLSELFDEFLNPTGLLETKVGTLNDLLAGVQDSRAALDIRMQALQDSLSSKFGVADILIAQLKTTEDFLAQQFSILSAFYTNKR
ncbi:MAG: flagellar filament capping protein FliD [Pseudomonadales bacterium]|nr:flagellar filament capping protein FliD [Pseudomonadales bacterium]